MGWTMNIVIQFVTTAKVNMCFIRHHIIFIVTLCTLNCYALNCRSDGGPKEEDLKYIYKNCLKKQEGKNTSDSRRSSDQDWNQPRGYNQKDQWDRDEQDSRDKTNTRDDMGNRDRYGSRDRMGNKDNTMGNRYDRMGNRNDRIDDRNSDGISYRRDGIGGRNRDVTGYNDEEPNKYRLNGRDDFGNGDYGSDMPRYNYYSSTQPSRRFRRDRHKEMNSGHRSQYNPNAQKPMEYEDNYKNDDRNSSKNSSKDEDTKACALHCFLEHLEMIGDNGMPDKYLVTHAITKDVKNEDLRDFLQESIEECFQIIDNENAEDKCDFSKNLMMCLSEKGRANCDDWKDDLKF